MSPRRKVNHNGKVDDSTPPRTPTKKLTTEEIDNLARDYETKTGCTQRSLADDYQVSKSQVNRALMKKGIKIRKERERTKKTAGSKATDADKKTKSTEEDTKSPLKGEKLALNDSESTHNSASKNSNTAILLKDDNESSDGSNSDDDKSLQSFDDMSDLGEFYSNKSNEGSSSNNLNQNSSSKFPPNVKIDVNVHIIDKFQKRQIRQRLNWKIKSMIP